MKFRRFVYGLGVNMQAPIALGISMDLIFLCCYMVPLMMAAFTGIVPTGKLSAGSPEFGKPYLITTVTAAALFRASQFGREGNIPRMYLMRL